MIVLSCALGPCHTVMALRTKRGKGLTTRASRQARISRRTCDVVRQRSCRRIIPWMGPECPAEHRQPMACGIRRARGREGERERGRKGERKRRREEERNGRRHLGACSRCTYAPAARRLHVSKLIRASPLCPLVLCTTTCCLLPLQHTTQQPLTSSLCLLLLPLVFVCPSSSLPPSF